MLQAQTPIGNILYYLYKEPELIDNLVLNNKIEKILDVIKYLTPQKGLNNTCNLIHEDIFNLRIELLNYISEHLDFLDEIQSTIIDEISNKLLISGTHKKLAELVSDSSEIYLKVFSYLKLPIVDQISNGTEFNMKDIPTLKGLKYIFNLQPTKEFEYFIKWLESSLNLDYCLIVSQLVFIGDISLKTEELHHLRLFLKKSIIDYGSLAILLGLWEANDDDETQMTRNIKIAAAALELENRKGKRYSDESLKKLIVN